MVEERRQKILGRGGWRSEQGGREGQREKEREDERNHAEMRARM